MSQQINTNQCCAKQTMCTNYDSGKEDFHEFLTLDAWLIYCLRIPCIYWENSTNQCHHCFKENICNNPVNGKPKEVVR